MEYLFYEEIPESDVLNGIMQLHEHVFDGSQLRLAKLIEKKKLLVCVAIHNERVVGFKIGYEIEDHIFYSWLGGVHSDFRGRGIAPELMKQQHEIIKSHGYTKVRTTSRNKRREMLLLNIKFGFDIIETFTNDKGTHKIILEKEI